MALKYALSNKQITDLGGNVFQCSYTCTVSNELDVEVLTEQVAHAVNKDNSEWANLISAEIATQINGLLDKANDLLVVDKKTDGIADNIAARVAGE